jgi:hypothetical protein
MPHREGYRELSMDGLRDAVMDELAVQYSRSNLSMEEYDQRCGRAAQATARAELMALVEDLPVLALPRDPESAWLPAARATGTGGAGLPYKLNAGSVPPAETVFNVFSGTDRKGAFRVARAMHVINVFGGCDIDLSQALLPPEGCQLNLVCVFGGCDIKVPPGVNVDVRGIGVFGGFGKRVQEVDDPSAPTIRISGVAVFGGCDVKTKGA